MEGRKRAIETNSREKDRMKIKREKTFWLKRERKWKTRKGKRHFIDERLSEFTLV